MTANLIQANERQQEKELDIQTSSDSAIGLDSIHAEINLQRKNIDDLWDSGLLTEILHEFSDKESSSDIFVVDSNGYKIIL